MPVGFFAQIVTQAVLSFACLSLPTARLPANPARWLLVQQSYLIKLELPRGPWAYYSERQ
jgi:hypothetical protein